MSLETADDDSLLAGQQSQSFDKCVVENTLDWAVIDKIVVDSPITKDKKHLQAVLVDNLNLDKLVDPLEDFESFVVVVDAVAYQALALTDTLMEVELADIQHRMVEEDNRRRKAAVADFVEDSRLHIADKLVDQNQKVVLPDTDSRGTDFLAILNYCKYW